jgi:drug/metabolite transporter (DMT)-like permease
MGNDSGWDFATARYHGSVSRRTSSASRPRRLTTLPGASPSSALIWLALSTVYVIWGSTYLAIREAIRTIPPLLSASVRFLMAGGLLYLWALRRGDRTGDRPVARHWLSATVVGGCLLLGGNGAVVWAEQHVPTGIVALLIATVPLWMALIERFVYGQRLARQAIAGLVVGFGGAAFLVGGPGSGHVDVVGVLVVLFGALAWASGSLYSRRAALPSRPLVATGMEMLAGGVLLGLAGVVSGEAGHVHPSQFSTGSLVGLAYLIVFGSWIAFSAYIWLLRVAPISLVSTYAYVNPVVAVLLGWAVLSERITGRTLFGGAVIVVGVALIITARKLPPGDPADCVPEAQAFRRGAPLNGRTEEG